MLAWILEHAGLQPGFLVGGVPLNFGVSHGRHAGVSARLTGQRTKPAFVIEADEYDTAFFDKRSKFVHYRPRTAVLNNLEFDHADIFDDLAAIERQFHHLVRTVPPSGRVVVNGLEESLDRVLHTGCWSEVRSFGAAVSDFSPPASPMRLTCCTSGATAVAACNGTSAACTTSSMRWPPLRRQTMWAWRRCSSCGAGQFSERAPPHGSARHRAWHHGV
jgi:UDP-N-acetylmuramate: L-alanyl-gamma-D-glutamyl-meso-diaminopimelate ligase